ncbi:hypothetical protein [Nocardia sp. NPDC051981]|uniref:hypothetical protein n=1 Tax=Nocardia sp. NPDC051981 TaxID=3155417 RepID=UPI0034314E53
MDPNAALTEIRNLIKQYNEIGVWDVHDLRDLIGILIELTDHVSGLDQWLSQGGFLPKEWEWARTPSTGATVAEARVIDLSQLSAVIGTQLKYLRELGVIVGDIDVADEMIVSAIQARWTVFTDSQEVTA